MKGKIRRKKSIAFKLIGTFFIILLIQGIIMSFALVFGGVIWEIRNNEFMYFAEETNNCRTRLESEMKNVWTNFQHYTNQISQSFSSYDMQDTYEIKTTEEKLLAITPYLTDALRETKTTGVFLILADDTDKDGTHSAIYLKNADPTRYSWKNVNFTMRVGAWSIADKYGIMTQDNWSFQLTLDENNRKFYDNAMNNIGLSEDESLLGYWSAPFTLTDTEEEMITYTIPLTDNKGKTIGVFGIEVSLEYLNHFIEIEDKKNKGFFGLCCSRKIRRWCI